MCGGGKRVSFSSNETHGPCPLSACRRAGFSHAAPSAFELRSTDQAHIEILLTPRGIPAALRRMVVAMTVTGRLERNPASLANGRKHPTGLMQRMMNTFRQYLKVSWSVVGSVQVFMVRVLFSCQWPSQFLFHDGPVLSRIFHTPIRVTLTSGNIPIAPAAIAAFIVPWFPSWLPRVDSFWHGFISYCDRVSGNIYAMWRIPQFTI